MGEIKENAKGMIKSYLSGFLRACLVGLLVVTQIVIIAGLLIFPGY